jgi:AraC family transcriptional regulator
MQLSSDEVRKQEYRSRLNRAIDYIQNHFDEDLNLTKLAEIACFSKFHFHRIFLALVGETVNDFVRRIRLEKALHKLILDKSKSITEIAIDCGFSSSQNFAKIFKAHYGVTPSYVRTEYNWGNWTTKLKNFVKKDRQDPQQADVLLDNQYRTRYQLRIFESLNRKTALDVRIVDAADFRVAYVRSHGSYNKKTIAPAFTKLLQWANPKGLIKNGMVVLGAIWSRPDITPEDKMIFDACITVPKSIKADRWINIQVLPGGKFAVHHCEIKSEGNQEAWSNFILNWLLSSDYQPDDRPLYQIYYNDSETHPLKYGILDLCLPIKPLYE